MASSPFIQPATADWVEFLQAARPRQIRDMLEWARDTLRIPDGPFANQSYDPDTQPFSRIWLEQLCKDEYYRRVFIGPQQCGKTFNAFGIPTLYSLFELKETTLCGVPDLAMVNDKWEVDLLPMIRSSEYADLLPTAGAGSGGGRVKDMIKFRNGAVLRFMTGGGGDKSRAGFTTRILNVTEIDGFDSAGATSREADKLSQLEGRVGAFGDAFGVKPYVTFECTLTDEDGRSWREYSAGTESRLAMPCPHCEQYVSLGRDDLVGWQDAGTIVRARALSHFVCYECKSPWTDAERKEAAKYSVLVHAGQLIDGGGNVTGEAKETETLGFRVSAVDNMFKTMGDLGVAEWKAARDPNEENAERVMRQWWWAIPTQKAKQDDLPLSKDAIMHRQGKLPRRVVLDSAIVYGVGVDLGKHFAHFCGSGLDDAMGGVLADYGVLEVQSASLGERRGIAAVIDQSVDVFMQGTVTQSGHTMQLGALLIDAGNWTDDVLDVVNKWKRKGVPIYASKGFGASERYGNAMYSKPKSMRESRRNPFIGRWCHEEIAQRGPNSPYMLKFDADAWKTDSAESLSLDIGEAGSVVLFPVANEREHARFANHITAEKKVEEFKVGKAPVVYWERVRRENHYFDAYTLSRLACYIGMTRHG